MPSEHPPDDVLADFLPPVATWFRSRFAEPTLPQRLGWPIIRAGKNALIIAPTGSGKTLAAFLVCLDRLWRQQTSPPTRGVQVLYLSPLKALNADIARNLEGPLAEIVTESRRMRTPLRAIAHAVRTGDTQAADRQRMIRRPPDLLITTPESLHLMLTSRARETLRTVRHVIVDEIHAVSGSKRGVFLSLLLERLSALTGETLTRIGLSATQKPLEEVAQFLGGRRLIRGTGATAEYGPRPVEIVDAGRRRALDLEASLPAGIVGQGGSIWPLIEERVADLVASHKSTIVFANNRRTVERLATALDARAPLDETAETLEPDDADARAEAPVPWARPHHGSLSLETRQQTESMLKQGALRAVVATGSLELGIDLESIELVCQVESPGGVARALQRVGRAGHVVGGVSRGRLFAKTTGDLLEIAALVRAMLAGDIESLRVPTNCLDVLAQQVVACVASGSVSVHDLFNLARQSYAYRGLTSEAFESVLSMVSGRFGIETFRDLRPRIAWDRVHNALHPLPGTAQLALVSGGTIPDTGQYPLYLGIDGPRLGELDEEFVFERRVGETFRLGQATWRIQLIDAQKVVVAPAEGHSALMPFWRGEGAGRSAELGEAVGKLCREAVEQGADAAAWLARECHLDADSAAILARYISRQRKIAGAVPDDRTILVEAFKDEAGETGLAVLTTFGARLNHALKLVLTERLRRRFAIEIAGLHSDDGILLRLPGMDEPPLDILDGLSVAEAESLIRESLADSALFGLRFRQNAGRALLMPRPDPGKRAPLWLQRLRARDLLQAVRRFPEFPIVIETYRECLDDDLDMPRLRATIQAIERGDIKIHTYVGEASSPFTSELRFRFTQAYLYEWDEPRRGDRPATSIASASLLDSVLEHGEFGIDLAPEAIGRLDRRLRGMGRPPRTRDEMSEHLARLGDLTDAELEGPMEAFLRELEAAGRAVRFDLPHPPCADLWISADERTLYESAFAPSAAEFHESRRTIVRRFVHTRALIGLSDVVTRYPLDPAEATELLESFVTEGALERIAGDAHSGAWAERRNLAEAKRLTIALRRRESIAVTPEVYADFVLDLQRVAPGSVIEGEPALASLLDQFEGFAAPADFWESELFARRLRGYRAAWLDAILASGMWSWRASGALRGEPLVTFHARDSMLPYPEPDKSESELSEPARRLDEYLQGKGAFFVDEIAHSLVLPPTMVRQALDELVARGRVTADRLDPLRAGGRAMEESLKRAVASTVSGGRHRLGPRPRGLAMRPVPRWSLTRPREFSEEHPLADDQVLDWASRLLARYGVLCRETCGMDLWAPPWRAFLEPLTRAELRGDVRRGYFVEGLSGVQYALPETADALARRAGSQRESAGAPTLLSSLDPANLYGGGAPFDIPLLEGGNGRLTRLPSNYLVIISGRPVLIIEGHGKRLAGLASASDRELRAAVALLPRLIGPARITLRVEQYNGEPLSGTPAADWLAEAGFVRDLAGMTLYRGWT